LEVGERAPAALLDDAREAIRTGRVQQTEIEHGERCFWCTFAASDDEANVYAHDFTKRKTFEKELLLANQRLGAIMEAVPVGVSFSDDPECKSITGNSVFRAQFGLMGSENMSASSPDPDAFGRRVRYLDDGRELIDRELPLQRAVAENRTIHEIFEVVLPGGHRWVAEASAAPVRDLEGNVIGGVVASQDITERRRANAEREGLIAERTEALNRVTEILESMADGFVAIGFDWRCTYVNEAGARILTRTKDALAGMLVFEAWPEARGTIFETELRRAMEQRVRTRFEIDYAPLGKTFDCRVYPSPEGISVFFSDETEQRAVRRALEKSEARFRQLAEALPQMVFEVFPDGSPGYFNERWQEFTGREPGELAARAEHVHPEDRPRLASSWQQAVRTGSAYDCEYRVLRHDGQYRWVLSRALPAEGEDGKPERWIGAATDIHDLKQTQHALAEAMEQLELADRRKNEFLAVLSHELRNPLTPIRNSLHLLEHAAPASDQARRAKDILVRQVAHLSRLVDDLLDVTRVTRNKIVLQREDVELCALMRGVADDQRSLFEQNGLSLDVQLPSGAVFVDGDAARLAQVMSNLLQNAVKFTQQGGRVTITLDDERGRAVIRVRDDGLGMTDKTISQLFQPFVQAESSLDRSEGGLGLGLALVKGLVELHGGAVTAHSDGLGHGSEFVVSLPKAAPGATKGSTPPPRPSTSRLRVLIIEDNADAAETLRDLLVLKKHEVEVAFSGPDGVAKAKQFRPHVVLCDIGLPGMDGYEVARTCRADDSLHGTHLVALTGYALPEDVERAKDAGFDHHIAKPPSLKKIMAILGEVARSVTE
ncbi:MAG: PAS domain-containing protein, partial [Myxococcota bacterium]